MVDALSAKIEMELGELEPDEAAVFMEELGLAESSLDRVIALSYRLLGLISFLTAGPDEVRAWPIPDGSTRGRRRGGDPHRPRAGASSAPRRSRYEDLLALGSMAEAKKAGKAPLGGPDLPGPRRRRDRDPVQPVGPRGRRRLDGRSLVEAASPACRSARIET